MYANNPEMAAKWEADTPAGAKLPERVAKQPSKKKPTTGASYRMGSTYPHLRKKR